VATSIGEEGLDIGHVDLIISYDVLSSQLRIVQRFGRTGRKRAGRCVTLMIKGAEEEKYDKVQADKTRRMRELKSAGKKPSWLRRGQVARMLPPAITPTIEYKDIRPVVPSSVKASRKRARAASVVAEAAAAATGDSSAAGEQDACAIDDAAANNDDDDGVAVDQDGLYAGLPARATGGGGDGGGDDDAGELDQQMESLLNGMDDAAFAAAADLPFDSTMAQEGSAAATTFTSSAASVLPAALSAGPVPGKAARQPLSKRLDAVAQTLKGKAAVAATAAPAQSVQSMFGRLQAQQQQQLMERKLAREAKKGAGVPRMEHSFVRSHIFLVAYNCWLSRPSSVANSDWLVVCWAASFPAGAIVHHERGRSAQGLARLQTCKHGQWLRHGGRRMGNSHTYLARTDFIVALTPCAVNAGPSHAVDGCPFVSAKGAAKPVHRDHHMPRCGVERIICFSPRCCI
jgi:hypothetical protein